MQEVGDVTVSDSRSEEKAGHEKDQTYDEDKENEPEDEDENSDDDGGGWITPSNIRQVKMDSADWTAPADVKVGCLTTDFAMQVISCSIVTLVKSLLKLRID